MKTERKTFEGLRDLLIYNGSGDERNQGLYNKAGYFGYLFLFLGILAEMLFKLTVWKLAFDQTLPEFTILALSVLFTTAWLVRWGATGFENRTQERRLGTLVSAASFAIVVVSGYTALGLHLPQAAWLTSWGPAAWAFPPVAGALTSLILWTLVRQLSRLMNTRANPQ